MSRRERQSSAVSSKMSWFLADDIGKRYTYQQQQSSQKTGGTCKAQEVPASPRKVTAEDAEAEERPSSL